MESQPSLTKTYAAAVFGVQATTITLEFHIHRGINFSLVGLPDSAVRESQQRVKAAIETVGYSWPGKHVTVNMAPADIRKEGSAFDLPIALGCTWGDGSNTRGAHGGEYDNGRTCFRWRAAAHSRSAANGTSSARRRIPATHYSCCQRQGGGNRRRSRGIRLHQSQSSRGGSEWGGRSLPGTPYSFWQRSATGQLRRRFSRH